jgi:hypothetical protein
LDARSKPFVSVDKATITVGDALQPRPADGAGPAQTPGNLEWLIERCGNGRFFSGLQPACRNCGQPYGFCSPVRSCPTGSRGGCRHSGRSVAQQTKDLKIKDLKVKDLKDQRSKIKDQKSKTEELKVKKPKTGKQRRGSKDGEAEIEKQRLPAKDFQDKEAKKLKKNQRVQFKEDNRLRGRQRFRLA